MPCKCSRSRLAYTTGAAGEGTFPPVHSTPQANSLITGILMRGGKLPAAPSSILSRIVDGSSTGPPVQFPAPLPGLSCRLLKHFFPLSRIPQEETAENIEVSPNWRDGEAASLAIKTSRALAAAQMPRRGGPGRNQDQQSATQAQRKPPRRLPRASTAWSGADRCCFPSQCSPVSVSTMSLEVSSTLVEEGGRDRAEVEDCLALTFHQQLASDVRMGPAPTKETRCRRYHSQQQRQQRQ